jgi:PAS domain S-box-containing protein
MVPISGFSFLEYVHPDDREQTSAILKKAQQEARPFITEYRIIRTDGEERIISEVSELEYDPDGRPARMRGTTQDITERKKAETELLDAKERLEEAQNLGQMGSWSWIPDKKIEWWSDEHYRIFGLEPGSEIGGAYGFLKYIHPDDRGHVEKTQREAEKSLSSFSIEYRIIRQDDGRERTIAEHGEWIEDDTSGQPQWRGIIQDITERKRIEEKLAQLNAELEDRVEARTAELRAAQEELVKRERLATLGQLTATVSHELRNPLGAIRTSLYVLEKKTANLDTGLSRPIDRMNRSISRCDNIIDELLDFTRMRELDHQPLLLDEWLTALIDEQQIPDGISVRKKLDDGDIPVLADADRLRRAVINIVENACQAMDLEGVSLDGIPPPASGHRLSISTRQTGDRAEIVIEDTGPGVSKDSLDRIFEPLFSTKNFGVGLGLPIVQQIMRQHGGDVEVRNRKNRGARFVLWLPLHAKEKIIEAGDASNLSTSP